MEESGSERKRYDETQATTSSSEILRYQFSSDVAFSSVSADQAELLRDLLKLAEMFINDVSSRKTISKSFRVKPNVFAENLLKVRIKFSDWSKQEHRSDELALSWIDKLKTDELNINDTFWKRYEITKDELEKQRIKFIIALCLVHECGHLALQWTTDKSFKRGQIGGKSFVITPEYQGEAGRFLERRLFDNQVHVFIKTPNNLDWNENVEITVTFEGKKDKFNVIDSGFISRALNFEIESDEITDFESSYSTKTPPGHSVLMSSSGHDHDVENEPTGSTPIRIGESEIPLCGTHFLYPHPDDD